MESICNNYRYIIERAVLSGIITEENRNFYLSAIEEVEGALERKADDQQNQPEASSNAPKNNQSTRTSRKKEYRSRSLNAFKHQRFDDKRFLNENLSDASGDTIENCSVFDYDHSRSTKEPGSISDTSLSKPEKALLSALTSKKRASSLLAPKTKERQNLKFMLDFKVPVYSKVESPHSIKSEGQELEDQGSEADEKEKAARGDELKDERLLFADWPLMSEADRRLLCSGCKGNFDRLQKDGGDVCAAGLDPAASEMRRRAANAVSRKDQDQARQTEGRDESLGARKKGLCSDNSTKKGEKSGEPSKNKQERSASTPAADERNASLGARKKSSCSDKNKKAGQTPGEDENKQERYVSAQKSAVINVKDLMTYLKNSTSHKSHRITAKDAADRISSTDTDYSLPSTPGTADSAKDFGKSLTVDIVCRFYPGRPKSRNPRSRQKQDGSDDTEKRNGEPVSDTNNIQNVKEKIAPKAKASRLPKIFTNIGKKPKNQAKK